MSSSVRVALFEDNKHLRESLYLMIDGQPGFECTGAFPDCNNWERDILRAKPDVILMDIEMPGLKGTEGVRRIKTRFPDVLILMQTIFGDDDHIFEAICAGATGYILKGTAPSELFKAILEAREGGSPMSPTVARRVVALFQHNFFGMARSDYALSAREKEILGHLVNGKSFKMIADQCGITYATVRTHMKHIYEKLHVNSNTEAVSKALKEKLL
ncbi:MAG TPA: response regulator transcription factor [Saprospiraceae bacterium]|nr:response regulator transcription factor [Saprospiraceae bacterium]